MDLVIHEKNPLRTVPVDRCGSPRFAGGTVIDICQNLAIIKVNRGIFKEGDFQKLPGGVEHARKRWKWPGRSGKRSGPAAAERAWQGQDGRSRRCRPGRFVCLSQVQC